MSRSPHVAFGVLRLKPAGGIEHQALRLAEVLAARGLAVTIFTTKPPEETPPGVSIALLKRRGLTNHARMTSFSDDFTAAARKRADLVVGFQKLRGLDMLVCGDWCFVDRQASWWKRLMPRYRVMAALERACFDPSSATHILAMARPQLDAYVAAYCTSAARTTVLPPTLDPRFRATTIDSTRRSSARARYGLSEGTVAWLWVGLQPHVKGLDRVFDALAARPEAMLFICGVDAKHRMLAPLLANSRRRGYADRIRIVGLLAPDQVAELFAAGDLLVHPARLEVAGLVILEALASGLPVITTANCGFAEHVEKAGAGVVLATPYDPTQLAAALRTADERQRREWSRHALAYGSKPELYSGMDQAADILEAAARRAASPEQVAGSARSAYVDGNG